MQNLSLERRLLQSSGKCHVFNMRTDEALVHEARNGDRGAAETLFRRYQDKIYGYLLRMTRNRDLAADATQETFIRGFKGLAKYEEKNRFKSWLYRIAHNEGNRILARQSGQPDTGVDETIIGTIPDTSPQPGESYAQAQLTMSLQQALRLLPAEMQTVVHLRVREDLSFREIAEITGVPLNTTLGRMHNAKKKLKELMAQEA